MNICLVLPNYGKNMINDPCCFPLGFMYVSSWVKQAGHEVKVLNYNLFDYDLQHELKGQDFFYLTGYEQFLEFNKMVQEIAHENDCKTVLGGALATFKTDEMKKIFGKVHIGEIEGSLPIDEISLPDYRGFGIEDYNKLHSVRYMGVLTSRGCPFSCTFCASTCKYRERDISLVSEEIDHYINKYHVEMIVLNDNTLNVRKERFMQICSMMKEKNLLWSAAIRADVFDEEMAVAAKKSGCNYFVVGVESFNQKRLNAMNKKLKVEQIKTTLDLLHKYDIDYHGNIILGLEDETTIDIAQELEDLPMGYKLFPVLAQSFAGNNVKSSLSVEERKLLISSFADYANSKGKYVYEGVA
jgi:radical SAM superfamily enzyme YgiQ (UPF0313 family)